MPVSAAMLMLGLTAQAPADTGAILYRSWCSSCHGADGRGQARASVKTDVPPADLASCATSTRRATTTCAFGPSLYWNGSAHGFAGEVADGFEIKR